MNSNRTKFIAGTGILAAIATVLMQVLEFPLPFMPPFLKLDFSTLPALIGGFAYGPLAGVIIALIKSLFHLLRTTTGGVGEIADMLATIAIVLTSSLIYKKHKTKKAALIGLACGSVALAIVGGLANYFILIPFFSKVWTIEQILKICGEINPFIHDKLTYTLYGAVPFNLIKGIIISAITFAVYKKISRLLHLFF